MILLRIFFIFYFPLIFSSTPIVFQIDGDCQTDGHEIAQEHGYRFVRQIFDGFCEVEEDPSSKNHQRMRRAIENGIDPATWLRRHRDIRWAESQMPKSRQKREFVLNDPQWNNMWYLMRHTKNPSLPDLNVTGAWELGYTGRGHVVTFLDDGLEFDHPDLVENYDKEASTDINGNDDDPTPRYDVTNENKHGTRCAGEVAAKPNNSICGVGIAYHARVGGIRMLDGDVTDSVEARSLSHRPDHVEIYSASWGPDDNGLVVDGPGPLAKKAFENGIQFGRGGKGSIFVWASGNGGRSFDSCACDGYIISLYTIAISSATEKGNKPWYLEECAATLASAYSSGMSENEIITTDLHHECTSHHSGTSAAAPLAAAIYALVLEANPNLTWRDVMYITVLGSRPFAIPSNTDLVKNAAGFNVSSKFGFGLMDAGLMTWYASGWTNVPVMSTCQTAVISPQKTIGPNSNENWTINLTECQTGSSASRTNVNYIEQVQVIISLNADRRGDTEMFLFSPSKTRTQILPTRSNDKSKEGFKDWPFLTVQLWGESPHGVWTLQVANRGTGSMSLVSYQMLVHGTEQYPISIQGPSQFNRSNCHVECQPDEKCGETDTSCATCRHFRLPLNENSFRCVGICPDGTFAKNGTKICLPCHNKCGSCRDGSETGCISCKTGFLIPSAMRCENSCPENYFTDRKLRKCIPCKSGCAACENSADVCSSCPPDFSLKDTNCAKASKKCGSDEFYDFENDLCRWCDSRCEKCIGPHIDQCVSCVSTSKYPYLQQTTCVASCSPGFYFSSEDKVCRPCFETCLNCTSSKEDTCYACKIGYVYIELTHRCEKPTGQPFYHDSKTGETRPCHSSCAQCTGPKATDCIACNLLTEVLLDDGHCVNDCPAGFFVNSTKSETIETNICSPCSTGCKKCFHPSQCLECDASQGFKSQNFQCVPICAPGLFLSSTNCEKCFSPCQTCLNQTHCLSCEKNFSIYQNRCFDKCPPGLFKNKDQCTECNPLCGNCTGPSETDCLTCAEGYMFDPNEQQCTSLCPNGNYFNRDDRLCHLCTNQCLECHHPGSFCRQCSYPMSLNTLTHQCLPCCTTNITTADCCQCPSIWDGTCIHPLVTTSIQSSSWWFISPLTQIREKFADLNRTSQTIILVCLSIFLCALVICLIVMGIYLLKMNLFQSESTAKHADVEYCVLNPMEPIDELNETNEQ